MADWGVKGANALQTLPGWAVLGERTPIQHCMGGRCWGSGRPYYAHASYDLQACVHADSELTSWIGQDKVDMRMFFLQPTTTSSTTEDREFHFPFFVNVDVVMFQLIFSRAKLVVWVPGLKIMGQ